MLPLVRRMHQSRFLSDRGRAVERADLAGVVPVVGVAVTEAPKAAGSCLGHGSASLYYLAWLLRPFPGCSLRYLSRTAPAADRLYDPFFLGKWCHFLSISGPRFSLNCDPALADITTFGPVYEPGGFAGLNPPRTRLEPTTDGLTALVCELPVDHASKGS